MANTRAQTTGAAAIQAAGGAPLGAEGASPEPAGEERERFSTAEARFLSAVERVMREQLAADRQERRDYGLAHESEPEKQDSNAAIFAGLLVMVERTVRQTLGEVLGETLATERRRLVEQFERVLSGGAAGAADGTPARPAEASRGASSVAAGTVEGVGVRAAPGAPAAPPAAPAPAAPLLTSKGLPLSRRARA